MPRDASPEQQVEFAGSDAEEFGDLFIKHLEIEYSSIVSQLPRTATWADCQRAMMTAVVKVLEESGVEFEHSLSDKSNHDMPAAVFDRYSVRQDISRN